MKAMLDDMLMEHKIGILLCVTVIASNIMLVHLTLSYGDYFSAYDVDYIKFPTVILFLVGLVYFIWSVFSPETTLRYAIMSIGTVAVCAVALGVIANFIPPTPYLEECRVLTYETEFISMSECMEYAKNNPDATGAQIINTLTENNKGLQIEDLLDRPLNP